MIFRNVLFNNLFNRLINKYYDLVSIIYLHKLKNKYSNHRGFIIGNGPSLRIEDLDKLKNEITIASNRIYLAFDHTDWRPSFYTNISRLQFPKYVDEYSKHFKIVHTHNELKDHLNPSGVRYWKFLGAVSNNVNTNLCFSSNLINGCYGGYTVTFENIQFAVHLGLNPIYLIGCDHYYNDQSKENKTGETIYADKCNDHFINNYRSPGESINPAMYEKMNISFNHAKRYASLHSINIYNATRGGHLEVFERVDFDTLFTG